MKGINLLFLITLYSCASEAPRGKERRLIDNVRQCYLESDSYTGKKLGSKPQMTVQLTVTPESKITACKVIRSDYKDPNLNTCVCEQFSKSEMNNPTTQTINLLQPVNFNPVEQ